MQFEYESADNIPVFGSIRFENVVAVNWLRRLLFLFPEPVPARIALPDTLNRACCMPDLAATPRDGAT